MFPRFKKWVFWGKMRYAKKYFFFSKTYPQNFIILHHKTPFGSIMIMRRKKWSSIKKISVWPFAGRPLGFYQILTTKKKTEYWPNIDHTALYWPNIDRKSSLKSAHLHQKKNRISPNIDHTALYGPNIDRKSSLKSAHLHYLLLSPELYTFPIKSK